ncbi:helix-turn-helix domain-containing protein [Blastococcus sp. Marseille-P5729]|uniref:helix-turn-helix domain-containing protein n=1 Tax=Blastococcus sp. Marseille-P5729 TaxID=2086582 RepID=UPI000D10B3E4|nr:helix-turn-helix domain-containing protein [Blastococcus sp. Marseille-P5729]
MQTIPTANIPVDALDRLDEYAMRSISPELRDVLLSLTRCIRDGATLRVDEAPSRTLTPSQVAERLGMSRTHLYKLLDRGEIVSHRVGRDRRVRIEDLVAYETRRQSARRELAERFAHQQQTRAAVVDEIADLL